MNDDVRALLLETKALYLQPWNDFIPQYFAAIQIEDEAVIPICDDIQNPEANRFCIWGAMIRVNGGKNFGSDASQPVIAKARNVLNRALKAFDPHLPVGYYDIVTYNNFIAKSKHDLIAVIDYALEHDVS